MCFFGGPSVDNSAYNYQLEQERKKQAEIDKGITAVNSAFDDPARQGLYDDIYQSTYDRNFDDLQSQYADAVQKLKFALARSGQGGSSVDVYQKGDLKSRYDQATLDAQALADRAKSNLIATDDQTRSNLINLIYGGYTSSDATNRAFSNLQTNYDRALAESRNLRLGDVFADLTNAYQSGTINAGRGIARNLYNEDQFNSFFANPGSSYAGAVS